MKKKIFASKSSSGFRSYLKFLLWAAIGLVVLVLFIPLTSRQKAGKEALKKPASEKGMVVREIPKALQPTAESPPGGKGEPAAEPPKAADVKPAATPDSKKAVAATESAPTVAVKEKSADTPPAAPPKTETTEVKVKESQAAPSAKPESTPAPPAPPAETKPKAIASVPTPDKSIKPPVRDAGPSALPSGVASNGQKPAPSADGRKMYTVQVAAVKDKNTAEEIKKALQKKGFDAAIKVTGDPKQGQTYALQLQPVDNMGKASTLLEQVKYVPQAKPTIITVPAGN